MQFDPNLNGLDRAKEIVEKGRNQKPPMSGRPQNREKINGLNRPPTGKVGQGLQPSNSQLSQQNESYQTPLKYYYSPRAYGLPAQTPAQ